MTAIAARIDTRSLRHAFGAFPTGVAVVAAHVDGQDVGLTVNSFTSVSLAPALVSVCVKTDSRSWPSVRQAERIGISILSAQQERISRQIAGPFSERFCGVSWVGSRGSGRTMEGAAAWFDCSLSTEILAGDHLIAILRVHAFGLDPERNPLVFHGSRYRVLAPERR